MPIKFKCPHCGKPLSVKEQLAGKKAKCPNASCGQAIVIPGAVPAAVAAPLATPSGNAGVIAAAPPVDGVAAKPPEVGDAEALAASVLFDEPAAKDVAPPKMLKFTCSYCDEEVEVDVALAGKQGPCPQCRRIIKIPHLQEQKKTDWRNANVALPSGARRDTEPAPEGAWGSTVVTRVSAEALEEADALPEEREPTTIRQWITRGVLAASVVAVLVFGTLFVLNRLAKDKKRAAYDSAMADVSGDRPTVGGYQAAIVHMAAGTYHIRRNEKDCIKDDQGDDNAWQQFSRARAIWGAGDERRLPECDAMLIELALAQFELAGDGEAVTERTRLNWKETRQEIFLTLRHIRNPLLRAQGMRLVTRKLIERGRADVAVDIANQFAADGLEVLAVAVLELQLAGENERANTLAGPVLALLEKQPLPVPTVEAQAVMIVKGGRDKANLLAAKMPKDDRDVAEVTALLAVGNRNEARQKALEKNRTVDAQFRSLVELADIPGADGKAAVEEAVAFAETQLANRALLAVPAYRLVDAGLRNDVDPARLKALADRVQQEERLRAWVQLPLFRHTLEQASGAIDDSQLNIIERGSLSQSLARVALAQHNTKLDADFLKQVEDWSEAQRAFGYIGAALGLPTK